MLLLECPLWTLVVTSRRALLPSSGKCAAVHLTKIWGSVHSHWIKICYSVSYSVSDMAHIFFSTVCDVKTTWQRLRRWRCLLFQPSSSWPWQSVLEQDTEPWKSDSNMGDDALHSSLHCQCLYVRLDECTAWTCKEHCVLCFLCFINVVHLWPFFHYSTTWPNLPWLIFLLFHWGEHLVPGTDFL